jgi:hypothetical protein
MATDTAIYELGTNAVLSMDFTNPAGAPANPTTVTLKLRKPSGALVTYTDAASTTVGTWTRTVTLDEVGLWSYRFEGTGAVVQTHDRELLVEGSPFDAAVSPTAANAYGATMKGVRSLTPFTVIDATTNPSAADVWGFIGDIANRIAASVGPLEAVTDVARRTALLRDAQGLVHLGAASLAMGANNPVLASPVEGVSYASWLWNRFSEGLKDLKAAEGVGGSGDGSGTGDEFNAYKLPLWSFPNTVRTGRATTPFEKF